MALREAVREALEEKARLGLPAYIWRDGKVVAVSPEEIREHLAKPEPPLATLQGAVNGTSESGSKPE
jgi:saccharopine dehydrogenase-like NADP-dependent oxidoreductase